MDRLAAALRDGTWLTGARARAWCRVLAAVTSAVALAGLAASHDGLDPSGKPLGTDFVSFWTASQLALHGHPASAYDAVRHEAMQRTLFPMAQPGYYAFFYPPSFLFVCLPLAALPYLAALAAWLAAGFAALYAGLRRLLPQPWAILPILAFPGWLVNAGHGQNGFITAACLGWGMALSRRPFLAGACLGLLAAKPHLLLAAPVVLLAARRWTMIAGAATSAVGLTALSWLAFGDGAWRGFLHAAPLARAALEQGGVEPWKMGSVFAAARLFQGDLLHTEPGLAYALQGASAIVACALLAWAAARRPGAAAEGALLITAVPLCTPFLLDYDLCCTAFPIAWVAAEAQRTAWRPWEKTVLLAAYVLPMVMRPLAMATGVPVAPFIMAALLSIVVRRTLALDDHQRCGTLRAETRVLSRL